MTWAMFWWGVTLVTSLLAAWFWSEILVEAAMDDMDLITIKVSPCAKKMLIILGVLLGPPGVIVFIGFYGAFIYKVLHHIGFSVDAAMLTSVMSCFAIFMSGMTAIIYRSVEGKWPWDGIK